MHLGLDIIENNITNLGCQFVSGMDEGGYSLNSVGKCTDGTYKVDSGSVCVPGHVANAVRYVARVLSLSGDVNVWSQTDMGVHAYKTSATGGPDWKRVVCRTTTNSFTGYIIDVEGTNGMRRDMEHRYLDNTAELDTQTWLLFQ